MKYKTLEDLRAGNTAEMMRFMNGAAIDKLRSMPDNIRIKWNAIVIKEASENYELAKGEVSFDLLRAICEWEPSEVQK